MGLGAVGVKAQVRIGGAGAPNRAAVLDLNADDSATPAGNKGALALPRVNLTDTLSLLNGNTPLNGMIVYNTNTNMTGGLGVGTYIWSNGKWVLISGNMILAGKDISLPITKGSTLAYDGNTWKPIIAYTLTIMSIPCTGCGTASSGSVLTYPVNYASGCSFANTWFASATNLNAFSVGLDAASSAVYFTKLTTTAASSNAYLLCLHQVF